MTKQLIEKVKAKKPSKKIFITHKLGQKDHAPERPSLQKIYGGNAEFKNPFFSAKNNLSPIKVNTKNRKSIMD